MVLWTINLWVINILIDWQPHYYTSSTLCLFKIIYTNLLVHFTIGSQWRLRAFIEAHFHCWEISFWTIFYVLPKESPTPNAGPNQRLNIEHLNVSQTSCYIFDISSGLEITSTESRDQWVWSLSTVSVTCHRRSLVWSLADDTARSYNGDLGAERLGPWAKSLCPLDADDIFITGIQ